VLSGVLEILISHNQPIPAPSKKRARHRYSRRKDPGGNGYLPIPQVEQGCEIDGGTCARHEYLLGRCVAPGRSQSLADAKITRQGGKGDGEAVGDFGRVGAKTMAAPPILFVEASPSANAVLKDLPHSFCTHGGCAADRSRRLNRSRAASVASVEVSTLIESAPL